MKAWRFAALVFLAGVTGVTGIAAAAPTGMGLRAVATCKPRRVLVQLTTGALVHVLHAIPGRPVRAVNGRTHDVFFILRIRTRWAAVTQGAGQQVTFVAAGPNGERWQWLFVLRQNPPLADPTNYAVCLHPLIPTGSFATHMHRAPGSWRFTASITRGRLTGSHAVLALNAT